MTSNILSEHFLQNLFYSQEPFAVVRGRLYTLSKANGPFSTGHEFHFLGKTYALEEAEEVSQLEKGLLTAKRSEIETMMSRYIHLKFVSKMEKTKAEVHQMQNLYSSAQDNSIERFIMVDVFNAYNRESRGEVNREVQVSKWDNLPRLENNPEIDDLASKENSLDPLVKSYGFIVIDRECYALYQNGLRRDENKGYVRVGNIVLDLKQWIPLEKLCSMYTQKLLQRINQKAQEHGKQFVEILKQMGREKRQLNHAINRSISTNTQARRGEIGFRKTGEGQYEITITIPPYVIEKDGEYFAFGTVVVGTTIKARNNQIMINDRPKVLSMPYLHPFVWPNEKICFGDLDSQWLEQRGVQFNHWYDLSNKKAIARKISIVMKEGKLTLERGYVGTGLIPVRDIHNCQCKIADDKTTAEQYARTHGISLERIIKND